MCQLLYIVIKNEVKNN